MQYIMHRVQAPITIGDLPPGLPSDDTHELGDDESLPSPPSNSILPAAGGDRCSCSSGLAPLAPPLPPLLMARLRCTAKN
jgi:hypothetical protein